MKKSGWKIIFQMLFKRYMRADFGGIASSFFLAMTTIINIDGKLQAGGEAASLQLPFRSDIQSLRGAAEAIFFNKNQVLSGFNF